jgi:hypothetical protein
LPLPPLRSVTAIFRAIFQYLLSGFPDFRATLVYVHLCPLSRGK